jgi:predicted transcriptional regulator
MLINFSKLDEQQRKRIIKKLVEKLGLSQAAKMLDVGRSTLYRYVNSDQSIPLDIVRKAAEMLAQDELSDAIYGLKVVEVDATTALSVVVKAMKDEKFRNFFFSIPYQYLGIIERKEGKLVLTPFGEKVGKVLKDMLETYYETFTSLS